MRPTRVKTIRIDSRARADKPFGRPYTSYTVLSPFGKRRRSFHTGVDLRARKPSEKKVKAILKGKVVKTGIMNGYGRIVVLWHQNGYKSRYAHLRSFLVKKGDWVEQGQAIGIEGHTGRAESSHLHLEIISPQGRFVNPLRFIR